MAELTVTAFTTLDGVVQAPGGAEEDTDGGFAHGGWLVPHFDEQLGGTMCAIFARADAFLLGRRTYDIFAGHWPSVPDPEQPIAKELNTLPKFVASRTRERFEWTGTEHVRDVEGDVPELKRRFERELQVHGSSDLAQALLAADLVDRFRLITFPVVLGSGKRLFGSGTLPRTMRLEHTESTSTGVVVGEYVRVGPLVTGAVPSP